MSYNRTLTVQVENYEVSVTFSGRSDSSIIHNVQQILLASFADTVKHDSGGILENPSKEPYTIRGGHHYAP